MTIRPDPRSALAQSRRKATDRAGLLLVILVFTYLLSAFTKGPLISSFQVGAVPGCAAAPAAERPAAAQHHASGHDRPAGWFRAGRGHSGAGQRRARRGRCECMDRADPAAVRGAHRAPGADPARDHPAEHLRGAERVPDPGPDVRRDIRGHVPLRREHILRQRADRGYPDLPVLQLHHADHARLRRLHRGGERRPGVRRDRGDHRADLPGHPGRPAGRRLPRPGQPGVRRPARPPALRPSRRLARRLAWRLARRGTGQLGRGGPAPGDRWHPG